MAAEDSNKVLYDILTERLEVLRALDKEGDSDRRRHIARETSSLHASLAHCLGLYAIKTEMEDLALKFTDYKQYKYKNANPYDIVGAYEKIGADTNGFFTSFYDGKVIL